MPSADTPAPLPPLQPGATYKLTVRSAEEAVQTIRERLGENARVLSVRQLGGHGLASLFRRPRLEVVAQVPAPETSFNTFPPPVAARGLAPRPAAPDDSPRDTPDDGETLSSRLPDQATARAVAALSLRDIPTTLPALLRRSGFSETMLARLQGMPAFAAQLDQPLHHAIAEVGRALRQQIRARPARPLPERTAFLGTPGVGRTTALCKWLAREVFTHRRMARVLKAEFDRPNPAEGLAVFCEALGVQLEHHAPASGDPAAEGRGAPAAPVSPGQGAVFADLPGLSLRAPSDNATLGKFLDREKFAGRVLVLNAAYDPAMLRRAYAAGRDLGATHLVFTHLDEIEHWGKLWDYLLEGELTPLFLSTGPGLTGDCETDPLGGLLRHTLPGA